MEAVYDVTFQRLIAILIAASFGMLTSRIAWKKGYYLLPPEEEAVKGIPHWTTILQAFSIFFFCELFIPPIFYALWVLWQEGDLDDFSTYQFSLEFKGWSALGIYALLGAALFLFFASLKKPVREVIWGSPSEIRSYKQNIKDFFIGSVTWLIAYPWVIVIGQVLAILFAWFYSGALPEQTAVRHLKEIYEHPWLFGMTAIAVVTIVPLIEELLFRGFLQSWLKSTFGRTKAILLTSLIFALFHFSLSQGIENVEFIASLFLLACFLGFVKERQRSLWASFGLHATFNLISTLMLAFNP